MTKLLTLTLFLHLTQTFVSSRPILTLETGVISEEDFSSSTCLHCILEHGDHVRIKRDSGNSDLNAFGNLAKGLLPQEVTSLEVADFNNPEVKPQESTSLLEKVNNAADMALDEFSEGVENVKDGIAFVKEKFGSISDTMSFLGNSWGK